MLFSELVKVATIGVKQLPNHHEPRWVFPKDQADSFGVAGYMTNPIVWSIEALKQLSIRNVRIDVKG